MSASGKRGQSNVTWVRSLQRRVCFGEGREGGVILWDYCQDGDSPWPVLRVHSLRPGTAFPPLPSALSTSSALASQDSAPCFAHSRRSVTRGRDCHHPPIARPRVGSGLPKVARQPARRWWRQTLAYLGSLLLPGSHPRKPAARFRAAR